MPKKRRATEPSTAHVPIIRANVNRTVVTSPTFVSLYSNDTQIQTSPWDVRLIFGEIQDVATGDSPGVIVKQTGEVRMSPQQAKALLALIAQQLDQYEKNFGTIPLPLMVQP